MTEIRRGSLQMGSPAGQRGGGKGVGLNQSQLGLWFVGRGELGGQEASLDFSRPIHLFLRALPSWPLSPTFS